MAPPLSRATNRAASSTVTRPKAGPIASPARAAAPVEALSPLDSTGNGRSVTKVSVRALTPVMS